MPYITGLDKLTLREGDHVKYVGEQTPTLLGKKGTVMDKDSRGRSAVKFENNKLADVYYPYNKNLALSIPDYQPGDIVRITPRDGTLAHAEGVEGVIIHVEDFKGDGTHSVVINSGGRGLFEPFVRNITLITAADTHAELQLSDVVRVGTEVGVLRALPSEPDGLYEIEMTDGDTLYVTRETMEKIT